MFLHKINDCLQTSWSPLLASAGTTAGFYQHSYYLKSICFIFCFLLWNTKCYGFNNNNEHFILLWEAQHEFTQSVSESRYEGVNWNFHCTLVRAVCASLGVMECIVNKQELNACSEIGFKFCNPTQNLSPPSAPPNSETVWAISQQRNF